MAEYKAKVDDPGRISAQLEHRAPGELSICLDTLYDWPDRRLRVRLIQSDDGERCVLSYSEHETDVRSAPAIVEILAGLGFKPTVSYTKECSTHRFEADGLPVVATLVHVPELGEHFVEIVAGTWSTVLEVLRHLALADADLDGTDYAGLIADRLGGPS